MMADHQRAEECSCIKCLKVTQRLVEELGWGHVDVASKH
jgi:hypothetical protein